MDNEIRIFKTRINQRKGEICLHLNSAVWFLGNFSNSANLLSTEQYSPNFLYNEAKWCFGYQNRNISEDRFRLCLFHSDVIPITVTYKMCIKDIEGKDFWTSAIVMETFKGIGEGSELLVSHGGLLKQLSRITERDVLTVYITFYPEGPLLPIKKEGSCKILQNLRNLYMREKDWDIKIIVGDKKIYAHQLILKCHSPVFSKMLETEMVEKLTGIIEISDCDPDVFQLFLLYLYSGEVKDQTFKNVAKLHYISEKYGVEDLAEACITCMITNLTVENFCDFVEVGLCYNSVLESANDFFAKNFKILFATEKWKNFNTANPEMAYELANKALEENEMTPKKKARTA